MTDGDRDTFCVLPWIHLCATVDGVWGRCCVDGAIFNDDLYRHPSPPPLELKPEAVGCLPGSRYAGDNPDRAFGLHEAFNSPSLRRTRLAMLAGEPVEECTYCYRRERLGGRSYRQSARAMLADRVDIDELVDSTAPDGTVPHLPSYLDLRLGNSCNLRCVMCGYPTSSRWGLDVHSAWAPAHVDPYNGDAEFWQTLRAHAQNLRRVYVAGGEPFLQRGHFRLIELLVESGSAHNIDLVYNTNLTVLPRDWLPTLRNFRSVGMGASCDGTGDVFEKIRVGACWSDFVHNLRAVKPFVTSLWLAVAPQRDNVLHLGEIVDFARTEGVDIDLSNAVHWPTELALDQLPASIRSEAARSLRELWLDCQARGESGTAAQIAVVATVARVGAHVAGAASEAAHPARAREPGREC